MEDDITRSSAQDWVTIRIPVSLVETMLNTVCSSSNIIIQKLDLPFNRNIMSGRTERVVITWSEQAATVFPRHCTSISSSFTLLRCSVG
jgi:hypothetical protein